MRTCTTIILLIIIAAATVAAQNQSVQTSEPAEAPKPHYAEARWSRNYFLGYYGYTAKDKTVFEGVIVRTPGQVQGIAGAGKQFTVANLGTINAMLYGVLGNNRQAGLMPSVYPNLQKGKFKTSAFLGWFIRLKGDVPSYLFLDAWDATIAATAWLDLGSSTGFFLQQGKWNSQFGPMVRLNLDQFGSYNVSYRFGPRIQDRELRVWRIFIF